ncbi:sigma-54-dependent transcriptional regulator [Bacillus taeanensis]|uniref:Sigma-54-dependent Fis family transcriptional regulator n=1 Tax=Bacillus taeanensis TaxID=273032 RepID=A0A366XQ38_9BACI|nr:sigma-54 dependent transcriptional regulator [Bacillus taeanensis]RBW68480.1 sigma-54-dependent Fis family transcriptional regulator [Bacillus taeanensis]
MTNILIIDDEHEIGNFFSHLLTRKGYHVTVANSGKEAINTINMQNFHLAMIDIKLPDANGLTLLKHLKRQLPTCKAIIMTGFSTIKTAVEAIKLGADNYIEKPFDNIDELEGKIDELLENNVTDTKKEIVQLAKKTGLIIGTNTSMNELITMAYKIAQKNVTVLIEGETGTGKEVLARFIHQASNRTEQSFIGVNCGALAESLLESELFGHEKGAFTGASQQRKGLFEIANNGTLFLDEVAEASHAIQVKLLRVLETREFMRVGGNSPMQTNTRIIAASHANLYEAVKQKKFREDLLYRLDVVKLEIPPLRKRKEDIPLLVHHLLDKQNSNHLRFSDEAMSLMQNYEWFGNIRELVNVITRAITLADGETTIITPNYLPIKLTSTIEQVSPSQNLKSPIKSTAYDHDFEAYLNQWVMEILQMWKNDSNVDFEEILNQIKLFEDQIGKAFVTKALRKTLGNRKEAAKHLKISTRKLRYLLNEKGTDL